MPLYPHHHKPCVAETEIQLDVSFDHFCAFGATRSCLMWHGKKEFVRARKIDFKNGKNRRCMTNDAFFAKRRFNDVDGATTTTTTTTTMTTITTTSTSTVTTTMAFNLLLTCNEK